MKLVSISYQTDNGGGQKLYQDNGLCSALVLRTMGHGNVKRHDCGGVVKRLRGRERGREQEVMKARVRKWLSFLTGGE
jgi:hypothetical protein